MLTRLRSYIPWRRDRYVNRAPAELAPLRAGLLLVELPPVSHRDELMARAEAMKDHR